MLKNTNPVHKITIVPRMKGSLGYTMQIEDEEEKFLQSKDELMNEITILVGGRAAEEEKFNIMTNGAANDIERATQLARSMVSMYGMSDKFDMMALESIQNRYLDGRSVRNCSDQTSSLLDEEALKIIKTAHENARKILRENMKLLDKIAAVLIEKENIFGDEFMDLIYEEYPEKKEEAEKEKIEKEKRIKDVEERRARRKAKEDLYEEEAKKKLEIEESENSSNIVLEKSSVTENKSDDVNNKSEDLDNKVENDDTVNDEKQTVEAEKTENEKL